MMEGSGYSLADIRAATADNDEVGQLDVLAAVQSVESGH